MTDMRAMAIADGAFRQVSCSRPVLAEGEVLIRVAYAGINRIDLLQRQGRYPHPSGMPAVGGLEISGEIAALGAGVEGWNVGDKVCALLKEGGFAEYAACHASLLLPVNGALTLAEAAAFPEALCTSWISLVWQAALAPKERLLIHGGSGGVGLAATQLARFLSAEVYTTAGSAVKCAASLAAGAAVSINYREQNFVEIIREQTGDSGVDVILDMVGGDYLARNLALLSHGGRLCIIAFLSGAESTVSLAPVLRKHLTITGSTLRSRPLHEKARIIAELRASVWPEIQSGSIKPVIDRVFAFEDTEKALNHMHEGLNIGKILLKV